MKSLSIGVPTRQIETSYALKDLLQGQWFESATKRWESLELLRPLGHSSALPVTATHSTRLYARSVSWRYRCSERGLTVRSSCGSLPCLLSDLGYSRPWKPSQTKPSRSTFLDAFDNIESIERFVAYVDEFDSMAIKPITTSEMWEFVMEDDWWYMFEERPELSALFDTLTARFKQAVADDECDVFRVSLDVKYSLRQPPGVKALQWGHHLGTTEDGYIFKAKPSKAGTARSERNELTFVTGFVRTITLEPLG